MVLVVKQKRDSDSFAQVDGCGRVAMLERLLTKERISLTALSTNSDLDEGHQS